MTRFEFEHTEAWAAYERGKLGCLMDRLLEHNELNRCDD